MKLRRVALENFRAWEHCAVQLGARLTVCLGENGSGKTALLDGIAIGLGELLIHLPGVSGVSFRNRGDIHQSANQVRRYTRISLESTQGLQWDRSRRRDKSRATAEAVPAGVGVKALRHYLDREVIEPWGEEQAFLLPVVAYYGVSRAVLDIPLRRRNFPREYSRFDALAHALDANTHFKSAFAWFYFKENEEHVRQKAARSFDVTLPELDAVRRAITNLFPDLRNPRIELNPLRLAVDRAGETLDITQLSDGYRTLLGLVMDLASRLAMANPHLDDPLAAEAVVMIDEVDLHLHPAWQRRVVEDLLRTFPNTQFILTTHSPFIVESVNNLLKRNQIDAFLADDREIRDLLPLAREDVAAFLFEPAGPLPLMDEASGLLDDQLLQHFNAISRVYDRMRDIEWTHRGSA